MTLKLLEMDGTAEEIHERLAEYSGRRLHVVVTSESDTGKLEVRLPVSHEKLSIEEKIMARFSALSKEEISRIPDDLSDNLDHYIYGLPKK